MDKKARILIVDDTPSNIKILHDLLCRDYRISAATSGVDALELLRSDTVDLILLDVMMPEMDGYEVCRRLKADPETDSIPVIFVTAKSEIESEQMGLELGAVDYISKPISPPITVARIKNHLELKQARDHLEDLVRERTQELTESNRLLSWHVKELEGHEQLVQAQLRGLGEEEAYPQIRHVLQDVFNAERLAIYRVTDHADRLETVADYGGNVGSTAERLTAQAVVEKSPKLDTESRVAVAPMMHQEDLVGLICLEKLQMEPDLQLQLSSLCRMAQEAAVVLRMGQMTDDLLDDDVDLDGLLNLDV